MPAPRTPAEFKALISDPSDSLCGNFIDSLLKLPLYVWQIINYIFDADGNINDAFAKLISDLTSRPGDLIFSGRSGDTEGRLLCNGTDVSRDTYADLFTAIGTTYGPGDGVTTFTLPDYRDVFPMGASGLNPVGTEIGGEEITITEAQLPKHIHHYGIGGTPNVTVASTAGFIDTDGSAVRYQPGNTTKAAETFDFGPNTPTTQDTIVPPLPKTMPCYIYIKT
jgi:microcystin-dependent protein